MIEQDDSVDLQGALEEMRAQRDALLDAAKQILRETSTPIRCAGGKYCGRCRLESAVRRAGG